MILVVVSTLCPIVACGPSLEERIGDSILSTLLERSHPPSLPFTMEESDYSSVSCWPTGVTLIESDINEYMGFVEYSYQTEYSTEALAVIGEGIRDFPDVYSDRLSPPAGTFSCSAHVISDGSAFQLRWERDPDCPLANRPTGMRAFVHPSYMDLSELLAQLCNSPR